MTTAICTLFEKHYHYGVAALVNSLYSNGFRGVVWAGYRGQLPFWAESAKDSEGYKELEIAEGCSIKFVELETEKHFSFYKPDFMWQLMNNYCPEVDALFYFDPDIVNKANWPFYEKWVSRGIALCGDCWYHVPSDHPRRLAWLEFAESQGFVCERRLDYHYNGGFIGVPRELKDILSLWQKLIELGHEAGCTNYKNLYADNSFHFYPYLFNDQTYLNLALMLCTYPLTTLGPDGMDFLPCGVVMSHAVAPATKPWRKKLILEALKADPPTITDKLYWKHTQWPIQLYSKNTYNWNKFALLCGTAIGRFMHRPGL